MITEFLLGLAVTVLVALAFYAGRQSNKPCPADFRLQNTPTRHVTFKNLPNNLIILRGELVDKTSCIPVAFSAIPDGTEVNVVPHHDLKKQLTDAHLYRCSIDATLPAKNSQN